MRHLAEAGTLTERSEGDAEELSGGWHRERLFAHEPSLRPSVDRRTICVQVLGGFVCSFRPQVLNLTTGQADRHAYL